MNLLKIKEKRKENTEKQTENFTNRYVLKFFCNGNNLYNVNLIFLTLFYR